MFNTDLLSVRNLITIGLIAIVAVYFSNVVANSMAQSQG